MKNLKFKTSNLQLTIFSRRLLKMKGNISIVKKIFIIQLFTVFSITLSAEPYKPYPILFVHGINSGSLTCRLVLQSQKNALTFVNFIGKIHI